MNFHFDDRAADNAVWFIETFCRHIKGELAGHPLKLLPWENEIVRDLFGWKRDDGTRRFRSAYIEVAKKNGKSTKAAGVGNKLLFADGEPGAEIYSVATNKEQAAIVHDVAKQMVLRDPELSARAICYKDSIVVPRTYSSYRVLSRAVDAQDGLNGHGVLFDELHRLQARPLFDVMQGIGAARRQPLHYYITTAGEDTQSVCGEMHDYAERVIADPDYDPTFYAKIYAADPDDDWMDPAVWAKANPSLGHTISVDFLRQEAEKARRTPAREFNFRRLHLNQWIRGSAKWLNLDDWDACAHELPDLVGRDCFGGLDLAAVSDLAGFVLVFPPLYHSEPWWVLFYAFLPEDSVAGRKRKDDRDRFRKWIQDGHLIATPGNRTDHGMIREVIREAGKLYRIREIGYDSWNAYQLAAELMGEGLDMVEVRQGFKTMNVAMKAMERLLLGRELGHGGHPVARWCADNVVAARDPADNIKPDKPNSADKIDLMSALLTALYRAMAHHEAPQEPAVHVF